MVHGKLEDDSPLISRLSEASIPPFCCNVGTILRSGEPGEVSQAHGTLE